MKFTVTTRKLSNNNRCSICGKPYVGFGHNARPVRLGRCCSHCNDSVVIPRRFAEIAKLYADRNDETKE